MTKRSGSSLLYLITLGAALVAIVLLRRVIVATESSQVFLFSPWFLLAAVIAFLVQESLNPVFAALALKSVGQSTRYVPQLLITMLATSANSTVPVPAGMPIRAFLQKQLLDIPYTKSASAILIETAVGYGLTFLAAVITGIIWFREIIGTQDFLRQNGLLISLVGFVLLILFSFVFVTYVKKRQLTKQLIDAIRLLLQAKLLPLFGMVIIMFASFVLALLRFEMILYAMGAQAPFGPLMAALLLSRIAGVLSFIPMGLGVRDASLASLLLLIGIPGTYAAAGAALDRVIMTIPYLIGGVIATHVLGKRLLVAKESTRYVPPTSNGEV